jgi:hypothetical protein
VIDFRIGTRTLETTVALVASVALCCVRFLKYPLLLVDDHAPYRTAILQVFGPDLSITLFFANLSRK